MGIKNGLIIALVLGATLSILLSLILEIAVGATNSIAGAAIGMPVLEELCKGLSLIIVAFFIWKTIPNRRYAAALGAAIGLGFAITETIVFAIGAPAAQIATRVIAEPVMHPLWDSFVGIGLFVLMAQRSGRKSSPIWLGWAFMLIGLTGHILWNSIVLTFGKNFVAGLIVDLIVISVPLAILLRDVLGGHFNFQNFFDSPNQMQAPEPKAEFPPPPPPPT
jgi:protease PrsW